MIVSSSLRTFSSTNVFLYFSSGYYCVEYGHYASADFVREVEVGEDAGYDVDATCEGCVDPDCGSAVVIPTFGQDVFFEFLRIIPCEYETVVTKTLTHEVDLVDLRLAQVLVFSLLLGY